MKVAISISALLIGASIFYYLVIFLPQKNQQQLNSETVKTIQEASNQDALNSCLNDVNQRVSKTLAEAKSSTTITADGLKLILQLAQQQKDNCYKQYPQK